jgi:hypothetical protein
MDFADPRVAKSLSDSVKTNKATYQINSNVKITVTIKDASNGALVRGASVDVDVINPSGSAVAHFHGTTLKQGPSPFYSTTRMSSVAHDTRLIYAS